MSRKIKYETKKMLSEGLDAIYKKHALTESEKIVLKICYDIVNGDETYYQEEEEL